MGSWLSTRLFALIISPIAGTLCPYCANAQSDNLINFNFVYKHIINKQVHSTSKPRLYFQKIVIKLMKKQQSPYFEQINDQKKSLQNKPKKKSHDHQNNPYKIIINVAECQYPVVRLVAKKLKWTINTEPVNSLNYDICWIDGHCRQEIFARLQPYQKINHFPGMEILSRKNFLGRSLMQFKRKFGEQYDFFPLTWNLPGEFADLKQYHQNRQQGRAQTFICKPQAGCQGRGIFLTRNIDKLKYERCVVQRYMSKPLLIDGLKFDLRIYVLITGIDPLRIFVYNQGLARFCTEPYETPKSDNLDNHFMHLTNYAINKLSPDFIFNENATQCDKGHKRSLSSIYKTLSELGHNSQQIKSRINDMIIKTIITGYPTLSRFQQGSHPENFANDMCFEILGFDVILNHKLNPFILQINYTPSFTTDTPFDKLVKKNLITDSIRLLNVNEKWKKEVRRKREAQIKERMISGKRIKYSVEEKQELIKKYVKLRDEYEMQNLGGFTKIFCHSQEQMLKYAHYYEFAEQLYQKQNKITGVTTSKAYMPFYMPFSKTFENEKEFYRTGFSTSKLTNKITPKNQPTRPKSIQSRRIVRSNRQILNNYSKQTEFQSVKQGNKQSIMKNKNEFIGNTVTENNYFVKSNNEQTKLKVVPLTKKFKKTHHSIHQLKKNQSQAKSQITEYEEQNEEVELEDNNEGNSESQLEGNHSESCERQ